MPVASSQRGPEVLTLLWAEWLWLALAVVMLWVVSLGTVLKVGDVLEMSELPKLQVYTHANIDALRAAFG